MKNNDLAAQIAALLERSGLSPEDAQAQARAAAENVQNCGPGTGLGHIYPAQLATIWEKAARAGRRRLVLEIVAEESKLEDDTGRVCVRVLEADTWPEWTPEHAAQRGATDALLSAPRPAPALRVDAFAVPPSWEETVREMEAEGAKSADEWEAEARACKVLN